MSPRPAVAVTFGEKAAREGSVLRELVCLGEVLREVDVRAGESQDLMDLPVLSLTKNSGLIPQTDRFEHRVARDNVSDYKVIRRGWLVYNPYVIWEGAIHILKTRDAGLVSPAYVTFETTGVDPEFLDYLVRTPALLAAFSRLSSGVVQRRRSIKKSGFLGIEVSLPTGDEQATIARDLSLARKAIDTTATVVSAIRELRRSLTQQLFTYGPVPVSDTSGVRLLDTPIGPLPDHWSVVPLGELMSSDPQNGIYKPAASYGEGIRIVRIGDYDNEGEIIGSAKLSVRLSPEEAKTYALRSGDILLNRVNSLSHLGKVALVADLDESLVFESNMMKFSISRERAYPEYVFRFLASPLARRHVRERAKRAIAQSSINQGDVKSLLCPLPPLSEQLTISSILSGLDAKIRAESTRTSALGLLFAALSDRLLSQRIELGEPANG